MSRHARMHGLDKEFANFLKGRIVNMSFLVFTSKKAKLRILCTYLHNHLKHNHLKMRKPSQLTGRTKIDSSLGPGRTW